MNSGSFALRPADARVVDHVLRFRVSTPEILRRTILPGDSDASVRRRCRRLVRNGVLGTAPLCAGEHYRYVTRAWARRRTEGRERGGPLSVQSLYGSYAVLLFCCGGPEPIQKITRAELEQRAPALAVRGLPHGAYFRDTTGGEERIGWIHVDAGAHPRRLAQRVRASIERRSRVAAWRDVIRSRRFRVTIATAREAKASQIQEQLEAGTWDVPVDTRVLPELRRLDTLP